MLHSVIRVILAQFLSRTQMEYIQIVQPIVQLDLAIIITLLSASHAILNVPIAKEVLTIA